MNIVVSGKHIELTDALKGYAQEKFSKLETFFEHILRVDVTLTVEDTKAKEERYTCDVTVSANGMVLPAKVTAVDLYASIDLCLEKIERQIKRFNEKLKERAKGAHKEYRMTHSILETAEPLPEDEKKPARTAPPKIVKSNKFATKPMFVEEAALHLKQLDLDFQLFRNAETDEVNLVYRMSDGSVGLIEPHVS